MGTDKEVILFEGIPHPVKCNEIRYYEDRRFTSRLMPKVEVAQLDIEGGSVGRTNVLVASAGALALAATAVAPVHAVAAAEQTPRTPVVVKVASVKIDPVPGVEEITKQFVAFVDGLAARSDLTFERFEKDLSVPFRRVENHMVHTSPVLETGARYQLAFLPKVGEFRDAFSLEFTEKGIPGDLRTICPVSMEAFAQAMKGVGYDELVIPGEIGQVQSIRYSRGDVEIFARPAVVEQSDLRAPRQFCLQQIAMYR